LQVIFADLGSLLNENDIEAFLGYVAENAKNLAIRLGKQGTLDKKVEKSLKQDLLAQEKSLLDEWLQLVSVSPGIPSRDPAVLNECRIVTMRAFSLLALQQIRYLGLSDPQTSNKEWAIRIMANVLDFGAQREASSQLLQALFDPEQPVSKSHVASLITQIVGLDENSQVKDIQEEAKE